MLIRNMEEADRSEVLAMMEDFYASDAVIEKSPRHVLIKDIDDCLSSCPFLEGYVLVEGDSPIGYGMISKSYTTEFGGTCAWIEDLYIKENYRHQGYGRAFLDYICHLPDVVRVKLEVEPANQTAVTAYQKSGFHLSAYALMTKEL